MEHGRCRGDLRVLYPLVNLAAVFLSGCVGYSGVPPDSYGRLCFRSIAEISSRREHEKKE